MRLRGWLAALALLGLAACAPYAIEPAQPDRPTPPPPPATHAPPLPPAVTQPPPSSAAPPAASPTPPTSARDQCGAAAQQRLVGRPRSEIPVPLDPNRQRVACTTCPVTMDFNPARLNFFYDAQTGVIREVRCG